MLHIRIIAVGKLKERFWTEACAEYLKRLQTYAKVEVVEIPDSDPAKCGGEACAIERESAAILKDIPDKGVVVLMDISGKEQTSEGFANKLDAFALDGVSDVTFIIGGSCGVGESVRKRSDQRWSLGRITLPHNLARVVLLEQIYRAFKIIKGEPYHK